MDPNSYNCNPSTSKEADKKNGSAASGRTHMSENDLQNFSELLWHHPNLQELFLWNQLAVATRLANPLWNPLAGFLPYQMQSPAAMDPLLNISLQLYHSQQMEYWLQRNAVMNRMPQQSSLQQPNLSSNENLDSEFNESIVQLKLNESEQQCVKIKQEEKDYAANYSNQSKNNLKIHGETERKLNRKVGLSPETGSQISIEKKMPAKLEVNANGYIDTSELYCVSIDAIVSEDEAVTVSKNNDLNNKVLASKEKRNLGKFEPAKRKIKKN